MSLGGQWIARYTGSNTGTIVIDIDEVTERFEVAACAWDDNPSLPSSSLSFQTLSRAPSQRVGNLRPVAVDGSGRQLDPAQLTNLGIQFPASVDIQFGLNATDQLTVNWTTSIGGNGAAVASRSKAGEKSTLTPLSVNTWSEFKRYVNKLEHRRYIFRGQSNKEWRLRSSFHRTGRANLNRFELSDLQELNRTLSSLTRHAFNLSDPINNAAFLNLVQHHGYPTPLLDWTWSPYIAAFFAFRNVDLKRMRRGQKVRIFKLDVVEWNKLVRVAHLWPTRPSLTIVNALAFDNSRAIPQQSISTVSTVDDIESHVADTETARGHTYLEALDLRAKDRPEIFQELALMGITAGSLFPGLDGACAALREQNF